MGASDCGMDGNVDASSEHTDGDGSGSTRPAATKPKTRRICIGANLTLEEVQAYFGYSLTVRGPAALCFTPSSLLLQHADNLQLRAPHAADRA